MKTAAPHRTRRTRRAGLLAALAVATLPLSGCMVNSPQATMMRYAPGDGIEIDGESLDARDLLVISHGDGAPGVVSGTIYNRGAEPATVTVTVAGQEAGEVTVQPGTTLRLDGGSEGERTVVDAVEPQAGRNVEVRLQADSETLAGSAPVLLPRGHYEEYADDAGGTVEPPPHEEGSGDH